MADTKKIHITIRLDSEIVKKIDKIVSNTSLNRSSYINKVLESLFK